MSRIVPLIVVLAALASSPRAGAEETITTANDGASGGAPTAPAGDAGTPEASRSVAAPDERLVVGPCGVVRSADAPVDRRAHGQIEVGIGTGGYRRIAGVVCKPIGDNASVTVAVEHTEMNRRARLVSSR